MIKHFSQSVLLLGTAGFSLATMGTIMSLIAALLASIYSVLKIYDWFSKRGK